MAVTQTFAGLEVPTDRYAILCPHGARIPIEYGGRIPRVTKRNRFCDECEAQREAGREQDARVKAFLKTLPKAAPVRRKNAVFLDLRSPVEEFELEEAA
jgi:hypothetical protein